MITNIWLKSQPNKKLSYPDCYLNILIVSKSIHIKDSNAVTQCVYTIDAISRLEFRP